MDAVKIAGIVFAVNLALSFAKAGLDAIKDKTETQVDNKAAEIIGMVAGGMAKFVDLFSANLPHAKK